MQNGGVRWNSHSAMKKEILNPSNRGDLSDMFEDSEAWPGPRRSVGRVYERARQVGAGIAKVGATLVCGGLGGVTEGRVKGPMSQAGGQTVGILPRADRAQASPYVMIPIVRDLGHGRNTLIASAADILAAISGGYGTLSEIGIGLKLGKPVTGLPMWPNMDGIDYVTAPEEALEMISGLKVS